MTPYSKLNSHGNDFIFVESHNLKMPISQDIIKKYSSRNNIGCDQFFIINTNDKKNINCQVFNQDGTQACQCGNGLRAAMLFLKKKYDINETKFIVCEASYHARIEKDLIHVNMGSPEYLQCPENIDEDLRVEKDGLTLSVEIKKDNFSFSFMPLSIGNNHCIVFSRDCFDHKDIISETIENIFGYEMNIGFLTNINDFFDSNDTEVNLIVNERGSGYTKSCGSGATAAAICLFRLYELDREIKVTNSSIKIRQQGGLLEVLKNYNPVTYELIGPSSFDGDGYLE